MRVYIVRRFMKSILILIGVSIIVFSLIHLTPGDPFTQRLDPSVSAEVREQMLQKMGYYDPLPIQYFKWAGGAIKGDFGYSLKYKKPVSMVIGERLPNTILLGFVALVISTLIAIPAGIISSVKKGSLLDYIVTIFSFIGLSIPAFFFGLLLIKWLSFDLKIFPISGMYSVGEEFVGFAKYKDIFMHLVLPAIVLALLQTATLMRYTRSSMLEVIELDFIRTARAKGVKESKVINLHAFRNALISIITVIMMQISTLFSGAVLTETIFVWPGIGRLNYTAILDRDYPLIMGLLMMTTVIILFSNLTADVLYAVADPRIRYD